MDSNIRDTGGKRLLESYGLTRNRRERILGRVIIGYTGWLLAIFVLLVTLVSPGSIPAKTGILGWLGLYATYVAALEIIAHFKSNFYETDFFRGVRIQGMVVFSTALVWITNGSQSLFWFVYLLPVLTTAIYFESRVTTFRVLCESLLLYVGASWVVAGDLRGTIFPTLLVNSTVLLVVSGTLHFLVERIQMYQDAEARLKQSELLQKIQKEIDSVIDRQEVLNKILEQAVSLVKARDGSLMLVEKAELIFAARTGRSATEGKTERRLKFGEGIAGQAAQTGRPYLCPETQSDNKFIQIQSGYAIRSMVAVPIISHGVILGVINVDSDEPNRFSWADVQLLLNLATQTATAIERSQLLHGLQQIGEKALANSKELYDDIVNSVYQLTHCPVAMWQVDERDKRQFRIFAHQGLRDEYANIRRLELESIVGKVVSSGKLDSVLDIQADERVTPETKSEAASQGWESILVVPLLASPGQAVGALSIYGCEKRDFTPWEIALLEAFAGQAGVAIQNSRRLQALALLREIGSKVSTQLNVDATLESVVEGAMQITDTDSGVLYLVDDKGQSVLRSFELPRGFKHPAPRISDEHSLTRIIASSGQPIIIPDVTNDNRVNPIVVNKGVRSMVGVPLGQKGKIVGVLYLNSMRPRSFTQDDLSLLFALAAQGAIAIEKARLLEEKDRRVEELGILTEIGRTVSNLGIDQILNKVYEQTSKIMDLSNAQVQFAFYDEAKDEMSFPLAVEQDDGKMIDRVRLGKREPEYRRTDDDEVVKQFRPRTRKERYGLNEYIVHNQKPLLILENFERKAKEVGVQVFPTFGYLDRPTHSFLGVPMMVGGKAIGAISIQSLEQERAYTQGDVELLSTVSNQAAVAIENARLLEQEKNHIDQLTVLQKAGVKVAAQLHLREVLGTIVENANTALRASFSTLFTYDVEGGRFIEGIRKGKIDTEPSIPSNTGIAAQIASSQGTIWAEKTEDFPNLKPTFIGTKGVQSFVGIPLVAKGKTMGVLFVNYFDFHIFPPRERTVIQLFAEQATVAIENARLYEQIQEANNKLRQAYEDLKQTQEQKLWAELGKTAGSLAHRIGNKGGIIRACVDDLRDHLRETNIEDDVLFEKLGVIQRNTQYMLEMSDLLFKPVQAAETELERVSPALLLRDAIKSADVPSSVVVKIDENIDALPKVLAKKFLVEVFVELIYNALAAMESSPERALDISGQISGDFVELRFKDTGIGIPPEKQETLFDLFVRQPTEKPGRQKHRGFGLWWVKSFLASTNGEVLLEESTIGKGSTFVVRLPLGGR